MKPTRITLPPSTGPLPGLPLQDVLDGLGSPLWLLDTGGTILDANRAALDLVNLDRGSLTAEPLWTTRWWPDEPEVRGLLAQLVQRAGEGELPSSDLPILDAQGVPHLYEVSLRRLPVTFEQGPILLCEARPRPRPRIPGADGTSLLDRLEEGVLLQDEALRVQAANSSAARLLAVGEDELVGHTLLPLWWKALREDGSDLPGEEHPTVLALRQATPQRDTVVGIRRSEGEISWLRLHATPLLRFGEERAYGVLTTFSDITQLRQQHVQMQRQANLDPLTQLPNRSAFFATFETEASRTPATRAVVQIDLDNFKSVNDRYDHLVGDQALQAFSSRLKRCVRPGDEIARLGGDEFTLLLRDVGSRDNLIRIARRLQQQLLRPLRTDETVLALSCSLGIAFGENGETGEELLTRADYALREAKRSGQGQFSIYNPSLSLSRRSQLDLEGDLRLALERGQLEVFYQPILNAKAQSVIGCEALMRWRHPERGLVGPDTFIPLAERTGLIIPMETWLVRTALDQLQRWNERHGSLRMSLNLSVRQLSNPEFLTTFETELLRSGAIPENIVLEITETYAMQRSEENVELLEALSDLGVALAIDDFGTGYSNLGYLQHLPFEIVKIDRSFMTGVPDDPRNTALVRTIIAMAQALDLGVVAEGIETNTQALFLYWEGADWVQGFHFSKPIPAAVFETTYLKEPANGPAST